MSNSRLRGPPLPSLVQGSSLQAQLQSEGAQIWRNNNRPLIEHIINHATPGYVTKVVWLQEKSIIEHEYLLMCVKTNDGRLSWMRVERMGELPVGSAASNALTDQAQLVVTLAPSRENLICDDRVLVEADLDTNAARLSNVAKLILIVHNEEPQYHIQWHNCWWLARVVMQVLSETYMHENRSSLTHILFSLLQHLQSTYSKLLLQTTLNQFFIMRFTGITAVFLAALVTDHVHANERCTNQLTNDWSRRYEAWSNSWVPNADAVCGNLWSNLGQYPECAGVSDQYCGYDNSGSSLVWAFTTGSGCEARSVMDSWYWATKNQWGNIDCRQG
ncbi:hypothetical protein FOVSG1_005957 [Fusarium oxysporum f. sp. vasinfectum]